MQSFAQIREQSDWSLPVRDTDTFDQDDGGRSALDGGNMVFFSSQPSSVVSAPVVEVNADTDDEDDECKTLTRLAKQEQLTFPRRGIDNSEELRSLERLKKQFCRKEKEKGVGEDLSDDLSDFARSDDEDPSGDMSDFARSDMSGTDDDLSDFQRADDDNDADADADDYTFLLMSY